jgi:dCTP deaminase
LEPEWEVHVTLEFFITTPATTKIYTNEGLAQVIFLRTEESCEVSYADRKGKYQAQSGITLPMQ